MRIRLIHKDGHLIQDRNANPIHFLRWGRKLNREFTELTLKIDCREKDVKLISYELKDGDIVGIVDWL